MARVRDNLSPRLAPLRRNRFEPADPATLVADGSYDGLAFAPGDVSGCDLSGASFAECSFERLHADQTRWRRARFVETRFDRLQAPALSAPGSFWRDVEVSESRLGAVELYDSELRSVLFSGCRIDWLNLRSGTVRDVLFRDCRIGELDLGGVRAVRLGFDDCRADSVRFAHAQLEHVDLRGLDPASVSNPDGMRGATITPGQAVLLAEAFADHLGVTVDASA